MSPRFRPYLVLAALFFSFCSVVRAQELVLGWEGNSSRGYAFVSPTVPTIYLDSSKVLFLIRGSLNHLYYSFPNPAGMVKVSSPAASSGIGLRFQGANLSATISSDFEVRNTKQSVPDGSPIRFTERGLLVQGNIFYQASQLTNVHFLMSYGNANRYLWARAGVKRQVTNASFEGPVAIALGLELTGQGNRDVRSYESGGVVELMLLRISGSIQLRSGYSVRLQNQEVFERAVFYGIGMYLAL